MSVRNPGDIRVENEIEAGLVNQLVRAINIAFTAADLLKETREGNDGLLKDVRAAEHHVAKLGIAVARRHLCKGIELSRRRGELIFLAGHMADAGVVAESFGTPDEVTPEQVELEAQIDSYEGTYSGTSEDVDNSEQLEAQNGGNETDLPY